MTWASHLKIRKKVVIVAVFFTIFFILMITSPNWIPLIIYPVSSYDECFKINSVTENYVNQPLQNDTYKSPYMNTQLI
jgi:hypothetical protein